MPRPKKKRRRGVWAGLWSPRVFILTVVALACAGGVYWRAVKWIDAYTARISAMESEVEKADNGTNIERYIVLKRNLEIERVIPFLWGLLAFLLLVFVTALIIIMRNANSSTDVHERNARIWSEYMEEKRESRSRKRQLPPSKD